MPTLKAFGRRWSIASDDFVFPQITEGILRCFWFFAALFIYVLHTQRKKCPEGSIADLSTFIVVLLVHNGVLVVICFMTAYVSSRGTIMNSTPRRFLPQFIYLRVPIFVFEVIWNIVGTVWIAEDRPLCHDSVILGTRLTIIMNWLIIAAFVLGVVVVFHPLGAMQPKEHNLTVEKTRRLWRRRVRWMCICANADDHAKVAFEDVADLMSCFFSDNDLVLSDVWAGLLLLANNDLRVMNDRQVVEPDVRDKPEWMNVQFATRMLDFAIGVYGWPTYTLNNCSCSAQCDLLRRVKCCRGCHCDQALILKDNCCLCNTAALLQTTSISEKDLFYVSFRNRIYEIPFIACADPISKSIVIAIRGTSSLRDIITDLVAADDVLTYHPPAPIDLHDGQPTSEQPTSNRRSRILSGDDARVHRGMLHSARFVYHTLDRQKILEDMFVLYPDYQLVVTGHSLGGGVATLVALMLRPQFPQVRCFTFSPPGCVVSIEAIPTTEQFVCSVVMGDDLVTRLTYQSMHRLKKNIIDVIIHSEQAKRPIQSAEQIDGSCEQNEMTQPTLYNFAADLEAPPPDPINAILSSDSEWSPQPNSAAVAAAIGRQSSTVNDLAPLIVNRTSSVSSYGTDEETANPTLPPMMSRAQLYPPGRIMLITPPVEDGDRPIVEWVTHRRLTEIKLSNRMISDHLPYNVREALRLASATVSDTWDLVV